MKYQKSVNLLETASDNDLPRFVTKKWIKNYDQSGRNGKEIRIKTSMWRADLFDYFGGICCF